MNTDVPYLLSTGNLTKILDKIQNAGAPTTFTIEFLKDLGFTASQDRAVPRLLKYIGMLDTNGHPTAAYREFMDNSRAKTVLAAQLRTAFDDLFNADKSAQAKSPDQLKGWFKTKTGAGDSAAEKMARTFKTLANYADWNSPTPTPTAAPDQPESVEQTKPEEHARSRRQHESGGSSIGLVYRFEIHLPDTQNIDTFRAIFKALREELM